MNTDEREAIGEKFKSQFKIICKKCGSDNCVLCLTIGKDWGNDTGYEGSTFSAGCNECRQNDFYEIF